MSIAQLSFELRPLRLSDVLACAELAGLAFESDRHTQLKARNQHNPYSHAEGMKAGLNHWLALIPSNAVDMTVAVDAKTQEPLGWVVWGFHGFNSSAAKAQRGEEANELGDDSGKSEESESSRPAEGDSHDKSPRKRLEMHTGSDLAMWMRKLMPPEARCMYICSIAVHPAAQGKGIGSALVRKGTNRADAEGVYCWVHASEDGEKLFSKQGFREVGRLELDLDAWNTEDVVPPEGSGVEWDTYTFRYMKRDANSDQLGGQTGN